MHESNLYLNCPSTEAKQDYVKHNTCTNWLTLEMALLHFRVFYTDYQRVRMLTFCQGHMHTEKVRPQNLLAESPAWL